MLHVKHCASSVVFHGDLLDTLYAKYPKKCHVFSVFFDTFADPGGIEPAMYGSVDSVANVKNKTQKFTPHFIKDFL